MKQLLLSIFCVVLTVGSSCSAVETARDRLAAMPEQEYQSLVERVRDNSIRLGRLGQQYIDFEIRLKIIDVSTKAMHVINDDGVQVADVGEWVLEYFDASVLPQDALDMIRDGLAFVDAAVGQIRLGIDGKITFREKQLMLTVIAGINAGLVS